MGSIAIGFSLGAILADVYFPLIMELIILMNVQRNLNLIFVESMLMLFLHFLHDLNP